MQEKTSENLHTAWRNFSWRRHPKMTEEKFAAFSVKIWRAKKRVERLRKKGAATRLENARDRLRLVFAKFQTAVLA